jgi:hypothetical protein
MARDFRQQGSDSLRVTNVYVFAAFFGDPLESAAVVETFWRRRERCGGGIINKGGLVGPRTNDEGSDDLSSENLSALQLASCSVIAFAEYSLGQIKNAHYPRDN